MTEYSTEFRFIAICLGMINELLRTNNNDDVSMAIRYMNELQKHGCKLRLIEEMFN